MSAPSTSERAHEAETVGENYKKPQLGVENQNTISPEKSSTKPSRATSTDSNPTTDNQPTNETSINNPTTQECQVATNSSTMQLTTQPPLIDHSTKYQLTDDHLYVLNYHVTTQSKLDEGRMKVALKDSMRWSAIIKALRRLRRENKLEHVSRRCEELKEKCGLDEGRMWDYLQEEMYEISNLRYTGNRRRKLGEVIFYYLVNNEELDEPVQKIIHRLHEPLYDHTDTNACFNWFELCAEVLQHEEIFSRFYTQLCQVYSSVDDVLIQILSKHPQLLFNKKSGGLIVRLSERFSCSVLNEIITNITDKNGRTCLFYITGEVSKQVAAQCIQRVDTLDKLLSIWKTEGHSRLESLSDTYRDLIKHDMFKYKRIADSVKGIALGYIQKLFNFAWDNTFYDLWEGMIEHVLSNHNTYVNQMLASSTDKSGQTYMFRMRDHLLYAKLFINRVDDLYKLLSICNTNGQTALHINTVYVTELLADTYTPKHKDAFIKLISITDENEATALQWRYLNKLASLIRRVENNEYVMSSQWDAHILIIYNTTDRPGAEEEAQTIYVACGLKYSERNIALKKNKTHDKMIELIKQTANKETCAGRLPSYLIVILASHGNVGTIDDCDGEPVKLSVIEEAMCSDILHGKPKMLITQCCQPIEEKSRDEPSYALAHDHFCAVTSCVSGQPSTRGVFLEKLAQKIETMGMDTNIFQLFQSVSREMEKEEENQTPIIMSTLKARLCPNDAWYEFK